MTIEQFLETLIWEANRFTGKSDPLYMNDPVKLS
jgi:hypothetical protein